MHSHLLASGKKKKNHNLMECWGCKPLSLKEWKVIEQHFCSKLPLRVLQGFADTLPSNTVLNWQMYEQGNWMAQKAPSPLLSINYKTHPKMLTGSQWFETLLKKPVKWSMFSSQITNTLRNALSLQTTLPAHTVFCQAKAQFQPLSWS